jgi:hypothetical protein
MKPIHNLIPDNTVRHVIHVPLIDFRIRRPLASQSTYVRNVYDAVFSMDGQNCCWMRFRRESHQSHMLILQYVIVDCEHGNIADTEMHESVTGVASSGASPIVRLRGPDAGLIKRALDSGALTVPAA